MSVAMYTSGGLVHPSSETAGLALMVPAMLGFLAVPPIIHGVHGNGVAAFGSAGLRLALPVGGYFAGYAASGCGGPQPRPADPPGDDPCSRGVVAAGFFLGVAAASAFDAIFLAREKAAPAEPSGPAVGFAPLTDANARPTGASVFGRF